MFGCRPRLPVDTYFPTLRSTSVPERGTSAKHVDEYITTVQYQLWAALQEAKAQSMAEAQRQKWYYDQKKSVAGLKLGNHVLVKANAFQGRRKVKDRWEDKPHEVVCQITTDIPLIWNERPTWKVMCPASQLPPTCSVRSWCYLMCGCLPSMGQMYQPTPAKPTHGGSDSKAMPQ